MKSFTTLSSVNHPIRCRLFYQLAVLVFLTLFTTQAKAQCGTPAPTMSLVDMNAAIASWSPVSGASWYTLQYRVAPSGAWSTLTSSTN